ncbi:MAG: hypothetical protein J5669_05070 [Bacteroidales bacterium]|nr:hypothetical protein [Bacteroidales bacterium]
MRKFLLVLAALLLCFVSGAQIVNHLKVDGPTFQQYAKGRMQLFNPSNLALADSLYTAGVNSNSYKLKCLGLSLEMPVRYAQGDYERMDICALEIKSIFDHYAVPKDILPFYYSTIYEYSQYLLDAGKVSAAMLEARAMERRAEKDRSDRGKMYAYSLIGLIQSYRSNPSAAIDNFSRAADFSIRAHADQELPNIYLLMAQEYVKAKDYKAADNYLSRAEEYTTLFPSIRIKCLTTRCFMYKDMGNMNAFEAYYGLLTNDPVYPVQTEKDARHRLDISYYLSQGQFEKALHVANELEDLKARYETRHGVYAAHGDYKSAYQDLAGLMDVKDSIYIKVQNEDLATLNAEMENARLREETQRLQSRNQMTVLLGFLLMFAFAFVAILLNQWQLRQSLGELRRRNAEIIRDRRAFQSAMDAKEAENAYRIKILQNRTTHFLSSYEDILNT